MMPAQSIQRFLLCAALLAAATLSHAEKADRNKPVNLEADRVTVDDVNKVHLFDGNVTLSQGTLSIRGDKLVVKQDAEGFQNGIATANPGNLAHFRVKREGKEEFIDGEAERIEHDARTEVTRLFNRAYVKSGQEYKDFTAETDIADAEIRFIRLKTKLPLKSLEALFEEKAGEMVEWLWAELREALPRENRDRKEKHEVASDHHGQNDKLQPVDRVVELVLDDVVGRGGIGIAELHPLLDLDRRLLECLPCRIVDLLDGAGNARPAGLQRQPQG